MIATAALAAARLILALLVLAPVAHGSAGDLELTRFEVTPHANASSPDPLQAGAHPDLRVFTRFCGSSDPGVPSARCTPSQHAAHLKDFVVRLPPGLWGNANAPPRCESHLFAARACPPATIVGELLVTIDLEGGGPIPLTAPIYNVQTTGLEFASFGTETQTTSPPQPLAISATVDAKHRLVLSAIDIPVPTMKISEIDGVLFGAVGGRPFVVNPTSCDVAVATLEVKSWESSPTTVQAESSFSPHGCGDVPFTPTATISHDPPAHPGSPSSWEVGVQYPCADPTPTQARSCTEAYENEAIWQSQLKDFDVKLPEGVGVAATSVQGLETCSPEQFAVGDDRPAGCPRESLLGTFGVETPLMPSKLEGEIFFGPPAAAGRPSLERPWPIFLAIEEDGIRIKLTGKLAMDENGRVAARLSNLPKLPLSRLELRLTGSAGRKPILTGPLECGDRTAEVQLTAWSGASVAGRPPVRAAEGCLGGHFQPALDEVAIEPTQAGAISSARVVISRPDDQRLIRRLMLSFPKGANGSLAVVPRCPLAQARAAACDEASRIGTVLTTIGSGSDLLTLPGTMYLAGASASGDAGTIAIVTPTRVGPVDLGRMVILARVMLRSFDARLEIAVAELPLIHEGIPLLLRRIELAIDPGKFWNPTGCGPRPLEAILTSDDGRSVNVTRTLSATGCDRLPFSPGLRLITGRRGITGASSHPPLRAIITRSTADAAIEKAVIALPSVGLDIPQLMRPDAVCNAAELRTRTCPSRSHIGGAKLISPLLPFSLSGPVFAVLDAGRPLPAFAMVLHGGGLVFQLRASSSVRGTAFEALPDVPISSLKLRIDGGPDGVLTAFSDLCARKRPRAQSTFTSHSGRVVPVKPQVIVNGCLAKAAVVVNSLVRISRSGDARLRVRCRRSDRCDGRVSLRAARVTRRSSARRRLLRLGSESFRIRGRRTSTVKVRLVPSGRRALIKGRRLRVSAHLRVGNSETRRRIELKHLGRRRAGGSG